MNFDNLVGELGSIVTAALIFFFIWTQQARSAPKTAKPQMLSDEMKLWLITEVRDPIMKALKRD